MFAVCLARCTCFICELSDSSRFYRQVASFSTTALRHRSQGTVSPPSSAHCACAGKTASIRHGAADSAAVSAHQVDSFVQFQTPALL